MCSKFKFLLYHSRFNNNTILHYKLLEHQYLKINHKFILTYFQISIFNILYMIWRKIIRYKFYICNNKKKKDKSYEIIENLGYNVNNWIVSEKEKSHLISRSNEICFQFENWSYLRIQMISIQYHTNRASILCETV